MIKLVSRVIGEKGKTLYTVTEQEVPELQARITVVGSSACADPETDEIVLVVNHPVRGNVKTANMTGREGLLKWYEDNVGYNLDLDNGSPLPIEELMDFVGSLTLLHYNQDSDLQTPSLAP